MNESQILEAVFTNASSLLVAVVGFFLVRTLRQVDQNLRELQARQAEHSTRIAHLEGFREGLRVGGHPEGVRP